MVPTLRCRADCDVVGRGGRLGGFACVGVIRGRGPSDLEWLRLKCSDFIVCLCQKEALMAFTTWIASSNLTLVPVSCK